ncbi:MAG: CocE/NonD family hydrolase [Sphingobacteriia bacterium]|nr:MAG: CocE/NonD family hydrolase [Sphingobacteriia bacterium]
MNKIFKLLFLMLFACSILQGQQSNLPDSLYNIQDSILIKSRDGASISVLLVRKNGEDKPLPVIFGFTIYARKTDVNKAKQAADKGYVVVYAYTRGKKNSPNEVIPYEHDGDDAYDVIDWISKQEWCNGSVGMYGGSYNGFSQWASTKKLHPALKTIVPSASAAPGLDAPMMNNVVMNFQFSWTYYVSNNKYLDNDDYNNRKQWNDMEQKWFKTGSSYRTFDSLLGRPKNKIFNRWLDHPTYDDYWQNMIPNKAQFAKINIPVLTTTGYFDGGQVGALYYMRELDKHNPNANQYLIIGPYGHFGSQGSPDSVYNGYKIDSVANISITNIIFQWFDYILKNKEKPAFLQNRINYQLMGTNTWKHAKSLSSVSNDSLTFFLDNANKYQLTPQKARKIDFAKMKVDYTNRDFMNSYYYAFRLIWEELNAGGGVMYKSAPLLDDVEFTGCFTGQMNVSINKRDVDYSIVLFEQMPDGKYYYLTYFMGRASYAKDNKKRELLTPDKKTALPFSNSYFTSRKLSKGSKLVVIVNVNKSSSEQINYGTGKDVSEETIKDAGELLVIKWYNDSFIKIPVWKN